jgi:hypothetical protein
VLDSDSDTYSDDDDDRSVFSPELGNTSTRAVRSRTLNYAEDNDDIPIAANVDEFKQGIWNVFSLNFTLGYS